MLKKRTLFRITPALAILFSTVSGVVQPANAGELANNESETLIERALLEVRYGSRHELAGLSSFDVDGAYNAEDGYNYSEVDEFGNPLEAGEVDRKSPLKAGLLSFLVPGLGQLYSGSHPAKIAGFVALEGLFWVKASQYHSDANDQIDEFQAYADSLWSEDEYWRYLLEAYGETTDSTNNHTHHLPATKTQQYYEMIGKYDQFSYGWAPGEGDSGMTYTASDRYAGNPYPSQHRLTYNQMRANANDLFSDRDRMVAFAILNHLVAGVDAALAAVRHNKKLEEDTGGLSFSPSIMPAPDLVSTPRIGLLVRF